MAEILAVPLKKPSDVGIVKPLVNLIASTYSTSDRQEHFNEQINEFSKLRTAAVWKAFEKTENSLEALFRYYDQLHALEAKIPPSDVQIPFKWKNAFNKGNMFVGGLSLTISSLAYERVCVLFNIAALMSNVAATQSLESDDGLKLAAKLLQQASGIFGHLKNTVISAIQVEPTPDLNPETLGALSVLMLAQAQEVFVYKAIHDQMKEGIIAKLSSQCEDFYTEALKLLQKDSVKHLWEKDSIPMVLGKQAAYHGLADYYQSIVCKNSSAIGEQIARLQRAQEYLKAAQNKCGRPGLFQDYLNQVERALTSANKDNNFIYHERIPDPKTLPTVPKAALAKSLPIPAHFSSDFQDLFAELTPMPVHQAMAAYDVRKNELVSREISELRKATVDLNGILASLNLPAALEESSGEVVPQSLAEKSHSVINLGGITRIESMISELPELLQRNTDILNETERLLNEEQASDDQLRQDFNDKWTRPASAKLTETFRLNVDKYRTIIDKAVSADKIIKEKFNSHKRGITLLSEGVESMRSFVPQPGGNSKETPISQKLRNLMEEVETMKAERDAIECELKSATTDMKDTFLAALANHGSINEAVMSTESLGRIYGPLQSQVKESVRRQQELLGKIDETNTQFVMERSGGGGMAEQRENALKELASAYDTFVDLENNLQEGTKFYNSLTQILLSFQNKVTDFCFARKIEKDELMKDMTQTLSRASSSEPQAPSHIANAPEPKREPPQRPPPPQLAPGSSATLPYPLQPHPSQMPVPYAPAGSAPYPTYVPPPMPASYNPYATIAGYPHSYQYPQYMHPSYPQQGPPGIPMPNQPQPGAPPHQQHPW